MGGSLIKIVKLKTKHFFYYSRHVRYLGCPLLGGFTVYTDLFTLTTTHVLMTVDDISKII